MAKIGKKWLQKGKICVKFVEWNYQFHGPAKKKWFFLYFFETSFNILQAEKKKSWSSRRLLPNHYRTSMKFHFNEISGAEGNAFATVSFFFFLFFFLFIFIFFASFPFYFFFSFLYLFSSLSSILSFLLCDPLALAPSVGPRTPSLGLPLPPPQEGLGPLTLPDKVRVMMCACTW